MEELPLGSTEETVPSQTSPPEPTPKKESRGLHGPSLGIGAGIAIVSIISAFLAISMIDNSPELQFEENSPKPGAALDAVSLLTENASPPLGDKNAPILLVEFGDYQCHFCNKFFHETEGDIIKNYVETKKVKIIFKDFTIIGPDSISAAHASHCAEAQGLFWKYHDKLYNSYTGENNGWAASENLIKYADELADDPEIDLDVEKFKECMTDGKIQQIVKSSSDDARNLGITGTPAFFIIGPDDQVRRLNGAQPYEVFQNLFEEVLEK